MILDTEINDFRGRFVSQIEENIILGSSRKVNRFRLGFINHFASIWVSKLRVVKTTQSVIFSRHVKCICALQIVRTITTLHIFHGFYICLKLSGSTLLRGVTSKNTSELCCAGGCVWKTVVTSRMLRISISMS